MKKYRLMRDGSLFPQGTIARQSSYSGNYDILCGGEFVDHVDAARIEGNTNWKEITKDQREEKVDTKLYNVDERDMQVFEEIQAYEKAEKLLKGTKFGKEGGSCFECCDYEEMYEEIAILLSKHVSGEDKKEDHQALREESLNNLHWLEMYEELFILNVNTNKSEPMLHVGFEVQMKYADAWRELLKKE